MNMVTAPSARANRMLGALPMAEYLTLASHLEPVQVQSGQVMESAGVVSAHAYFPVDCAVTLVSATRDGEMSELALIGREGMVGLPALLASSSTAMQSVVLRPGLAYRLPAPVFAQALAASGTLQALTMRYVQNLMLQMAQGVVCSLHHSVLQRLSTWLLFHHTVTASEQVRATHETIAHMLGVRRESITQAAGQLQQAGCLTTSRGRITLHDPQALRQHVCECYAMVEADHRQLWQMPQPAALAWCSNGLSEHNGFAPSSEDVMEGAQADGRDDGRYADIYDFAPVGLLSVDSQGRLMEVNMAAAIQLGISRSQCAQYRFVDFLQPHSRSTFEAFHREVLSGKCRRHCELGLLPGSHRSAAVVRLDAVVDESGEESRMVMVDVTESHRPPAAASAALAQADESGTLPDWWTRLPSAPPGSPATGLHTARQ